LDRIKVGLALIINGTDSVGLKELEACIREEGNSGVVIVGDEAVDPDDDELLEDDEEG